MLRTNICHLFFRVNLWCAEQAFELASDSERERSNQFRLINPDGWIEKWIFLGWKARTQRSLMNLKEAGKKLVQTMCARIVQGNQSSNGSWYYSVNCFSTHCSIKKNIVCVSRAVFCETFLAQKKKNKNGTHSAGNYAQLIVCLGFN